MDEIIYLLFQHLLYVLFDKCIYPVTTGIGLSLKAK